MTAVSIDKRVEAVAQAAMAYVVELAKGDDKEARIRQELAMGVLNSRLRIIYPQNFDDTGMVSLHIG